MSGQRVGNAIGPPGGSDSSSIFPFQPQETHLQRGCCVDSDLDVGWRDFGNVPVWREKSGCSGQSGPIRVPRCHVVGFAEDACFRHTIGHPRSLGRQREGAD